LYLGDENFDYGWNGDMKEINVMFGPGAYKPNYTDL
jgi:hypothetical protein